jgi:DNA-binding transcriptional regulator YiaG
MIIRGLRGKRGSLIIPRVEAMARRAKATRLENDMAAELFRRRIDLMREKDQYTQAAVAERLGVSGPTVWNWENGMSCPQDFDTWRRWAAVLGVRFTVEIE